jgi:hypothetical protein
VVSVAALPLLGSGKTDYAAVLRLAAQADSASPSEIAGPEPAGLVAS